MSRFEQWNPVRIARWSLGSCLLALGASLTACAHPVVMEPVVGMNAHMGGAVVQYGYGLPPAPLMVRPPMVMHPPQVVVPAPVYPYPVYRQPHGYGHHHGHPGYARGRGWGEGRHGH